jgi:hypothetical protein
MSASKFSEAEISMLWWAGLQSGLLGRVEAAELSKLLAIPIQRARSIVNNVIEIGFYEPMTRRMDSSKLPAMKWSAPMTGEELSAHIEKICGNASLS